MPKFTPTDDEAGFAGEEFDNWSTKLQAQNEEDAIKEAVDILLIENDFIWDDDSQGRNTLNNVYQTDEGDYRAQYTANTESMDDWYF